MPVPVSSRFWTVRELGAGVSKNWTGQARRDGERDIEPGRAWSCCRFSCWSWRLSCFQACFQAHCFVPPSGLRTGRFLAPGGFPLLKLGRNCKGAGGVEACLVLFLLGVRRSGNVVCSVWQRGQGLLASPGSSAMSLAPLPVQPLLLLKGSELGAFRVQVEPRPELTCDLFPVIEHSLQDLAKIPVRRSAHFLEPLHGSSAGSASRPVTGGWQREQRGSPRPSLRLHHGALVRQQGHTSSGLSPAQPDR